MDWLGSLQDSEESSNESEYFAKSAKTRLATLKNDEDRNQRRNEPVNESIKLPAAPLFHRHKREMRKSIVSRMVSNYFNNNNDENTVKGSETPKDHHEELKSTSKRLTSTPFPINNRKVEISQSFLLSPIHAIRRKSIDRQISEEDNVKNCSVKSNNPRREQATKKSKRKKSFIEKDPKRQKVHKSKNESVNNTKNTSNLKTGEVIDVIHSNTQKKSNNQHSRSKPANISISTENNDQCTYGALNPDRRRTFIEMPEVCLKDKAYERKFREMWKCDLQPPYLKYDCYEDLAYVLSFSPIQKNKNKVVILQNMVIDTAPIEYREFEPILRESNIRNVKTNAAKVHTVEDQNTLDVSNKNSNSRRMMRSNKSRILHQDTKPKPKRGRPKKENSTIESEVINSLKPSLRRDKNIDANLLNPFILITPLKNADFGHHLNISITPKSKKRDIGRSASCSRILQSLDSVKNSQLEEHPYKSKKGKPRKEDKSRVNYGLESTSNSIAKLNEPLISPPKKTAKTPDLNTFDSHVADNQLQGENNGPLLLAQSPKNKNVARRSSSCPKSFVHSAENTQNNENLSKPKRKGRPRKENKLQMLEPGSNSDAELVKQLELPTQTKAESRDGTSVTKTQLKGADIASHVHMSITSPLNNKNAEKRSSSPQYSVGESQLKNRATRSRTIKQNEPQKSNSDTSFIKPLKPAPKRKGATHKAIVHETAVLNTQLQSLESVKDSQITSNNATPPKRKRGRPRKVDVPVQVQQITTSESNFGGENDPNNVASSSTEGVVGGISSATYSLPSQDEGDTYSTITSRLRRRRASPSYTNIYSSYRSGGSFETLTSNKSGSKLHTHSMPKPKIKKSSTISKKKKVAKKVTKSGADLKIILEESLLLRERQIINLALQQAEKSRKSGEVSKADCMQSKDSGIQTDSPDLDHPDNNVILATTSSSVFVSKENAHKRFLFELQSVCNSGEPFVTQPIQKDSDAKIGLITIKPGFKKPNITLKHYNLTIFVHAGTGIFKLQNQVARLLPKCFVRAYDGNEYSILNDGTNELMLAYFTYPSNK